MNRICFGALGGKLRGFGKIYKQSALWKLLGKQIECSPSVGSKCDLMRGLAQVSFFGE